MYIQYLSHIQGVSFISLTAMKACIRHSNERHRAQENIKGISYTNSVLGQKILFFTWCEWDKKPTWHVSRFSIFWLPHSRTNRLERSSFGVWVSSGTSWSSFTKFSVGVIPMEGAVVVCVLSAVLNRVCTVSCTEPCVYCQLYWTSNNSTC
jgi:hypothetical protein